MAITSFATASSGSNDFSLSVGSTGDNTYVLDRAYPAGSYRVSFASAETGYDIYAVAKDGTYAGYTSSAILVTTAEFNQMSILGVATNGVVSFQYSGISSSPSSAGDVPVAGAYITSISDSTLVNADDSTTITGGNFATDVEVAFTGTDDVARDAKSIVRSSSTSIIATRPDSMPVSASPYSVSVSNPGIPTPTGSNAHILSNSVTAGGTPTWTTGTTLPPYYAGTAYSTTLVAEDVDGSVSYSLVSGSLPVGLSLNESTGVISGTSNEISSASFTIRATDAGGNYLNRAFTMAPGTIVSGGTLSSDSTYYYRTFTSSGTLTFAGAPIEASVLMIAGGAGGGRSGGGGAGGVLEQSATISANCTVVVGSGGAGTSAGFGANGASGGNSTFTNLTAAVGGGGGASGDRAGVAGGSGGGAGGGGFIGGAGTSGQGNAGANGQNGVWGGGGGKGGSGSTYTGGAGSNTWSSWATATSTGVSGFYAGGGAGRGGVNGTGGSGGGGGYNSNATTNTGSGGGGGDSTGFSGGSGLVIVRYTKASVGG